MNLTDIWQNSATLYFNTFLEKERPYKNNAQDMSRIN